MGTPQYGKGMGIKKRGTMGDGEGKRFRKCAMCTDSDKMRGKAVLLQKKQVGCRSLNLRYA
jgi:hypothetical protein